MFNKILVDGMMMGGGNLNFFPLRNNARGPFLDLKENTCTQRKKGAAVEEKQCKRR